MATPIAFVNAVAQLTNLIYNIGLGVSPILLGIAQMIPRFWDAISDPLAGYISDNTRTRWGRRRPYVIVGGFGVAITFVLIWTVPAGLSEYGIFAYYLGMSLLFYTAVTIFSVPLVALGCEMTDDYHERTKLFAYGSFIGNVFAILTPWMYHFANLSIFKNEVEGMKAVGIGVAVIILVSALVSGAMCKEKKLAQVREQEKIRFWPSIKATMQNRTYLRLIGVVFLVAAGFNFVNGFANYIMIYYLFDGTKNVASKLMGINGTAWAIAALIAVFPMTWTSKRVGKARTVQYAVLAMVIGSVLKVVCYNRAYPWLTLIPTVLISTGMLVLFTMAGAMIADICDEDELKNGVRREGSYSAVYSWWMKFAVSSAYLVAGFLLVSTGFDEKLEHQSANTLFWLRFWEIGTPALLCLMGYFLLRDYPLTEARAYEIKEILKSRRKPTCSNCGHDMTGNTTGRCPECGVEMILPRQTCPHCAALNPGDAQFCGDCGKPLT
ncbi:MAG: MFS transporter [Phycisphaerales bacterium]|nr:MFS transporter [Phycisphaerales bacterium]